MHQALGIVVAFGLGLALLAATVRAVALRWGIVWRDALTYFGVLPEQEEAVRVRRAPARPRGR
jgi:hypothetical protein